MKEKIENLGKVAVTIEKGYWDIKKPYDKLTVVEREGTGTTFISRKPVPPGTSILNRKYWIKFSKWSDIPYEITQKFGDSDELAISQKTLTNKFSEVESEIQEGDKALDQRLRVVEVHERIMINGGELEVATGYDLEHPESPKQEASTPTVKAILDASDDEPHLNSTKRFINSNNLAKTYGYYLDNPEFIYILTDDKYRIILGVKIDGDVVFNAGVPKQIINYVTRQLEEKVDKVENKSLIPNQYIEEVQNEEWIEVVKDSAGKIIEGIKRDGTKFISRLSTGNVINNVPNCIFVDKKGNGDYTSVTEAAEAANDGDTILVMPGIYDNEQVSATVTKTLYIIGVDREKCVIKNSTGQRSYPPMDFSGGCIRNLTIISEATTGDAYCIHMDNHAMKDNTICIENCTLINKATGYSNGCVGIGLRGGCILYIRNSTLLAPDATSGNGIYAHDNDWPDTQYNGLQQLKVIDCIVDAPNAVAIQGQGTESRDFSVSQYYIEFIRNRLLGNITFTNFYNEHGTITEDDFQGVKNLRLSEVSWGNSASVLNN